MAKYWKHLEYHDDDTDKHKITEEEILFLKKLQHEMNTQDNVGQANPRYWVIRDYEKIYGDGLPSPSGIAIYDEDDFETICEIEYEICDIDRAVQAVLKHLKEVEYDLSSEAVEEIKSAYSMASLKDTLEELEDFYFKVSEYQEIPVDKGFFFTQKAAEEHLRTNDYHYTDDAHTYAHTAWRSKESPLWDILQKVDFDRLN